MWSDELCLTVIQSLYFYFSSTSTLHAINTFAVKKKEKKEEDCTAVWFHSNNTLKDMSNALEMLTEIFALHQNAWQVVIQAGGCDSDPW